MVLKGLTTVDMVTNYTLKIFIIQVYSKKVLTNYVSWVDR